MGEKKYSLRKTLGRMLANAWAKNKGIFGKALLYTLVAGIYPFFAVLLPKLLIGALESGAEMTGETAGAGGLTASLLGALSRMPLLSGQDGGTLMVVTVLVIVAGYFLAAGLFAFFKVYRANADYNPISLLRMDYLADTFTKLLTMDYKYREDAHFLDKFDMALEANSSNSNGVEGIYHKLYEIPAQVLTIAILVAVVSAGNPLILVGLILNILVGLWVQNKANLYQYSMREEEGKAYRRSNYYYNTTYDFTYGKDIRLFDFRKRIIDNYNFEIGRYVNITRMVQNREFFLGFLALAASLVSDVLTYGCLIYGVLHGMSIADFSMYLTAAVTLMTALLAFSESLAFIHKEGLYVAEFYKFLDADLGTESGRRKALTDTLEIEFRNVTFRYPGTEKDIFKNLNFTIHRGEKLAIVGINGAGKSTLVKLMTGLYEPTEGEILINGIPQKEFNRQEYYKMFSVVFQDVTTVAFTIGENVTCTEKEQDVKRLWDCLDRVGLGDKVRGFEKGTDQMMLKVIDENGTQFSGGESQKLMIARALYKDGNMVILDEPTAALDALAEAEIYQDFNDLVAGKTAVYISHRLSSTKFCDKIALFDENGLAEYGSHEELMDKKGEYYHMFSVQGKYYREGETA